MPATTKKQQKFFQLIKAIQAGKAKGSAKAMELAKTMSPESVKHYTDLEKSATFNDNRLLQYAAISSLLGLGGAGLYGAGRYFHDKLMLPAELKNLEKDITLANNEDMTEFEQEPEQSEQLPEGSGDNSSFNLLSSLKLSAEKKAFLPQKQDFYDAMYYGAATPLAIIAPGLLSFHFAKKYIDRNRNKNLEQELQKAKKEFETALSGEDSSLKQEIDNVHEEIKQSGVKEDIQNIFNWFGGKGGRGYAEQTGPISVPGVELYPGSSTDAAGNTTYDHKPGLGPLGLTFLAGTTAGLAGLGGYMLMRNRLKDDPEAKKTKALKNLLKKDLAASAIQAGITVGEDPSGQKRIEL